MHSLIVYAMHPNGSRLLFIKRTLIVRSVRMDPHTKRLSASTDSLSYPVIFRAHSLAPLVGHRSRAVPIYTARYAVAISELFIRPEAVGMGFYFFIPRAFLEGNSRALAPYIQKSEAAGPSGGGREQGGRRAAAP